MKLFKNKLVIVALFTALISINCFLFYIYFVQPKSLNIENKKVISAIMNELDIGDTKQDVKNVFEKLKTDTLKLSQGRDEWLINMPLEFGATDWVLRIGFENDRITYLKMETSDGPTGIKPKGAPKDKINAK
jgi:hypothetical protein